MLTVSPAITALANIAHNVVQNGPSKTAAFFSDPNKVALVKQKLKKIYGNDITIQTIDGIKIAAHYALNPYVSHWRHRTHYSVIKFVLRKLDTLNIPDQEIHFWLHQLNALLEKENSTFAGPCLKLIMHRVNPESFPKFSAMPKFTDETSPVAITELFNQSFDYYLRFWRKRDHHYVVEFVSDKISEEDITLEEQAEWLHALDDYFESKKSVLGKFCLSLLIEKMATAPKLQKICREENEYNPYYTELRFIHFCGNHWKTVRPAQEHMERHIKTQEINPLENSIVLKGFLQKMLDTYERFGNKTHSKLHRDAVDIAMGLLEARYRQAFSHTDFPMQHLSRYLDPAAANTDDVSEDEEEFLLEPSDYKYQLLGGLYIHLFNQGSRLALACLHPITRHLEGFFKEINTNSAIKAIAQTINSEVYTGKLQKTAGAETNNGPSFAPM